MEKTLDEIHHFISDEAKKKRTNAQFWEWLNMHNVPNRYLKVNNYANKAKYASIRYIETLLDAIFKDWQFIIDQMFCEEKRTVVTGRLIVTNPVTGEQIIRSGIGESYQKQQAGPIAKSEALKNAAKSLGNIFGRSLNSDSVDIQDPYREGGALDKILAE